MEEKEFTPITSQEALDSVLKDRLNRQNEKHSKELAEVKAQLQEYESMKAQTAEQSEKIATLEEQLKAASEKALGFDSEIAERDKRIKAFEVKELKTKIAGEKGLSLEAVEFLQGETAEEISASAEKLSKLAPKKTAPLAGRETATDTRAAAFKQMLGELSQ